MNKYKKAEEKRKLKIQAVLESLKNGVSLFEACKQADVGWSTFWKWRKQDKELDDEVNQIIEARTQIVEDALFKAAIEGNVTAMIFWLCNRRPDRWKNINKAELSISSDIDQAIIAIRKIITEDGSKKDDK